VGALLFLLFEASQMDDVGLPNDDKDLAFFARLDIRKWRRYKDDLLKFFDIADGKLYNKRLTNAVAEYDKVVEINKIKSAKAVEARKTNTPAGYPQVTQLEPEQELQLKPELSYTNSSNIKENGFYKDKDLGKDKVEEQDELSASMLYALPAVPDLPPAIASDNNCTIDEAKYMIDLFVEKQRQEKKNYPNFTAAENHCIFWCRKRAKILVHQYKLYHL
jgi:uncharacterized protein YdaU (DUF1376 family)